MAEQMTDGVLKGLVSKEIRSAIDYDKTELSEKRIRAMEYYRGEMKDTPAEKGRSSVTSTDVADTMGWMLPGIIRVFTASDQMVMCEPSQPSDEEFCEQASDGLNYVFWKENNGYKILYDATHDSLLVANGIVKQYWDTTPKTDVSHHTGLTEEDLMLLVQDDDVEVLAHSETQEMMEQADPQTGQTMFVPVTFHDVKIKRTLRKGRICVSAIPPEDFLIDAQATCLEDARFTAHRREVTRSELIQMGFDRDTVDGLGRGGISDDEDERFARRGITEESDESADPSMRIVELYECYMRLDADGDGVAETVQVWYAGAKEGGQILEWGVWEDEHPFNDIPCDPVPHQWEARSVFDETSDIQRIKTVLTRQSLDNIYHTNAQQTEAEEGSIVNMDEVVTPTFGGVIIRKKGSPQLIPRAVPFIADKSFAAIQYFDEVIEKRTGVSRSTMALDPEALQNQTATASNNTKDAAYSQVELVARNQAELGWKPFFKKMLKLLIKHQDEPRTIRLRDKWVKMDPRQWNADMDVTINVGLGTGSRDRDIAMLTGVMNNQIGLTDRLATGGFAEKALEMLPKIVMSMTKIAESSGLKSPEQYYIKFDEQTVAAMAKTLQERASQGDPKVQAEQAKMQADQQNQQAQLQFEMQKAQAQMQMDQEKNAKDNEMKAQQMQLDHSLKQQQLDMEMQLKREQLAAELQLKQQQFEAELAMKREMGIAGHIASVASTAVSSSVRPGGEPG
jgi:hypothetical protein